MVHQEVRIERDADQTPVIVGVDGDDRERGRAQDAVGADHADSPRLLGDEQAAVGSVGEGGGPVEAADDRLDIEIGRPGGGSQDDERSDQDERPDRAQVSRSRPPAPHLNPAPPVILSRIISHPHGGPQATDAFIGPGV